MRILKMMLLTSLKQEAIFSFGQLRRTPYYQLYYISTCLLDRSILFEILNPREKERMSRNEITPFQSSFRKHDLWCINTRHLSTFRLIRDSPIFNIFYLMIKNASHTSCSLFVVYFNPKLFSLLVPLRFFSSIPYHTM